ncbi:hypothetical protein Poli38472_007229 [Pythium oligandrum]|uniref:AB hydrolase-1 domain-containing protein n=1 Tax=Pythium oligandrum TaxID=41045 RepID=A0A8K1FFK7_PYTOL|nr:hypothetical protein Poli38472_007229 [Pythium oligandrum]|eukprot:TMW59084.1 hypothetical protein Poli38472_007229 [Pythium oligandrum]
MKWAVLRASLGLLGVELRDLYRVYRRRVQLLLLLVLLKRVWRPYLLRHVLRLHYLLAAERPQLHFQSTPENERVLARCPTMTQDKYYPPWYLFNGHLQTVRLSREEDDSHPVVKYERQTLDMPDGGIISLDWALPPRPDCTIPRVSELDPTVPTMLLLPGLTGNSGEFYIRSVVHRMVYDLGWQCAVLNARGCGNTPLKTPQLFCSAYTDDLRHVVQFFAERYAFQRHTFVVVGFSMGSNVLVKYLGEEKEHANITAGVSVGNPFDLVDCSRSLRNSTLYRHTYDKALTNNLKELFFRKSNIHEVLKTHPKIDIAAMPQLDSVWDFDENITSRLFNYEGGALHYYTDASSGSRIKHVRVPLLCLNAKDDPISTERSIPYADAATNANVILCVTKKGGHLAFYESIQDAEDAMRPEQSWSARVIVEYAESVRLARQEELSHV